VRAKDFSLYIGLIQLKHFSPSGFGIFVSKITIFFISFLLLGVVQNCRIRLLLVYVLFFASWHMRHHVAILSVNNPKQMLFINGIFSFLS